MQSPVFISYSSKDIVLANKIVDYLESHGYPCWIAPRNITSGHDYTDMINDAILNCRAVVLIVSGRALQSQWVKKELSTAVSYNKSIIPYRISNVEITGGLQFLLNNVQWIDATANPMGKFSDLVDGLEQRLSVSSVPEPKRSKAPLIIGLAVAAVAVAGGALFLLPKSGKASEAPVTKDTAAVVTIHDTLLLQQPTAVVQPVERYTSNTNQNSKAANAKKEKETAKDKNAAATTAKKTSVVEEAAPVVTTPEVTTETKTETPKTEAPKTETPKTETAKPQVKETPAVTTPDTAGQAQAAKERDYQYRFRKAKSLFNVHNYKQALDLFEQLHREKPKDNNVNFWIKECRKMLADS